MTLGRWAQPRCKGITGPGWAGEWGQASGPTARSLGAAELAWLPLLEGEAVGGWSQQIIAQLCCSARAPCSSARSPLTQHPLAPLEGCSVMSALGSAAPALQRPLLTVEAGSHDLT